MSPPDIENESRADLKSVMKRAIVTEQSNEEGRVILRTEGGGEWNNGLT